MQRRIAHYSGSFVREIVDATAPILPVHVIELSVILDSNFDSAVIEGWLVARRRSIFIDEHGMRSGFHHDQCMRERRSPLVQPRARSNGQRHINAGWHIQERAPLPECAMQ